MKKITFNKNLWIGSFVVGGFGLIIIVWLWFSATTRQHFDTYRVVFNEPVDGVTINSIVKYNGVEVGKVNRINLNTDDPSQIYVDINIRQGIPVTSNTFATLKPQGITGMSFINLGLRHQAHYSIITPHNSEPFPIISTEPSLLYSLTEQAQNISVNINDLSLQFKKLLSDQNIANFSQTLNNLAVISAVFKDHKTDIAKSLKSLTQILDNAKQSTSNLNGTILNLASLSQSLEKNSTSLDNILKNLQNNTLKNVDNVILPEFSQTMDNLNNVALEFNKFLKTINNNPSILVRGKTNTTDSGE